MIRSKQGELAVAGIGAFEREGSQGGLITQRGVDAFAFLGERAL